MNHHDRHAEGCIAHFGVPACDCGADHNLPEPKPILASRWFLIAVFVCIAFWMMVLA